MSELAIAPFLLEPLVWKNKVLTGDALYCQRCLCRLIREAKGDYLFLVKGNQPLLFEAIRVVFALAAEPTHAGEGILFYQKNISSPMILVMGDGRCVRFASVLS